MKLSSQDSWSDLFVRDGILWRPVGFRFTTAEFIEAKLDEFSDPFNIFRRSDSGEDWAAKIAFTNNFCHEPEVYPESVQNIVTGQPVRISGFVVILKRRPQYNWTHLRITGVSTKMKEPGLYNSGVVFAEPATPYDMVDYLLFRGAMAKRFIECNGLSFDESVKQMQDILPREPRPGASRIFSLGIMQKENIHYQIVEEISDDELDDEDLAETSESDSELDGEEVFS